MSRSKAASEVQGQLLDDLKATTTARTAPDHSTEYTQKTAKQRWSASTGTGSSRERVGVVLSQDRHEAKAAETATRTQSISEHQSWL